MLIQYAERDGDTEKWCQKPALRKKSHILLDREIWLDSDKCIGYLFNLTNLVFLYKNHKHKRATMGIGQWATSTFSHVILSQYKSNQQLKKWNSLITKICQYAAPLFLNAQCNIAEQHIRGTHFSRWSTYNSRRWLWATAKFSAPKYETLRKYSAMQTYHKWQNVAIINNRIVSHRAVNNPQHDTAICGMVLWHRTVSIRVSVPMKKILCRIVNSSVRQKRWWSRF